MMFSNDSCPQSSCSVFLGVYLQIIDDASIIAVCFLREKASIILRYNDIPLGKKPKSLYAALIHMPALDEYVEPNIRSR
jgi:hypothetical protein